MCANTLKACVCCRPMGRGLLTGQVDHTKLDANVRTLSFFCTVRDSPAAASLQATCNAAAIPSAVLSTCLDSQPVLLSLRHLTLQFH